ncbi:RNA polymerase II holoenzyme cyclin-like subunit [Puccinia graminis f. sp. tritici]|uniref:RNA polymerase II holoenzyme cyclin-like subunit n=1 Tax=Puccinia graminis f. sp. tritici TaxID=56615 RepID=A0A5B0Q8L9_PUCGR|nr:RNA polymerase II holoenzyme cyclin-like subunit [Puccinia graminis f. sp. tritici]
MMRMHIYGTSSPPATSTPARPYPPTRPKITPPTGSSHPAITPASHNTGSISSATPQLLSSRSTSLSPGSLSTPRSSPSLGSNASSSLGSNAAPSLAHHPSSLGSNAAGHRYSSLIRKLQSVFSHSPSMTSTPGFSPRHTLTLPQLPTHSTRLIFEPSPTDSDDYRALGPFPNDATVLAEMEFYLTKDLDFHQIVWPYRDLAQFAGREDSAGRTKGCHGTNERMDTWP